MARMRFEAWALAPEALAEHRRRLMTGALAAATLIIALSLTSWLTERLSITRVVPPERTYTAALQLLEPPPPLSPPPPLDIGCHFEHLRE